jgi:uncharacterized protein YndB with AHSA1/START domain
MKWVRRILFVVIGLPVLAVFALFAAGQRENAGRNVERIAIARPPSQVLRHIEDDALLKSWTGLAEVQRLTEGPLRPGVRWRMVSEVRGQRSVMNAELTAIDPTRLAIAMRTAPGSALAFSQLAEYRVEERDGDTRLTVTTDTRYEGVVARLLEPLITRAFQRQLERNLARLRAQVEAEPLATAPAR